MNRLIASTMTHSTYDLKTALEKLKAAGFEKFELCSAGALAPLQRLFTERVAGAL